MTDQFPVRRQPFPYRIMEGSPVTRPSNSLHPQLIEVFLRKTKPAGHQLIFAGKPRTRLPAGALKTWDSRRPVIFVKVAKFA